GGGDRLAPGTKGRGLVGTLCVKVRIADGEDLVDQKNVGLDVDGNRESEAHIHARRIVLHRRVDEVLQPGEVDDLVESLIDLSLGETENGAVQVDVLTTRELGMEARTQLQERPDL